MEKQQSLDHFTPPPSGNNHRQQQQPHDRQTLDPFTIVSPQFASSPVRYGECLKNHAVKMGSHVTDGCGEFMPSGEEGCGLDFFKCAACNCHRNFHRKELVAPGNRYYDSRRAAGDGNSSPLLAQPTMMAMNFGGAADDHDLMFQSDVGDRPPLSGSQKKRFRTKFTREQKEEMTEFAEKIGWKIQKEDEQDLLQFCAMIGVKRQVFKVWMHNNRQAMKRKKKDQQES